MTTKNQLIRKIQRRENLTPEDTDVLIDMLAEANSNLGISNNDYGVSSGDFKRGLTWFLNRVKHENKPYYNYHYKNKLGLSIANY